MTRKKFINELKKRIKGVPEADKWEAIQYYEEYFDDAGIAEDDLVPDDVGDPKKIAFEIMRDYSADEFRAGNTGSKNAFAIIILAILAAPIGIPLAIAAIVFVFAFFMALIGVLFAIGAAIVGLTIGSVAFLVRFATVNAWATVFVGGLLLIAISLGIFLVNMLRNLITVIAGKLSERYGKSKGDYR